MAPRLQTGNCRKTEKTIAGNKDSRRQMMMTSTTVKLCQCDNSGCLMIGQQRAKGLFSLADNNIIGRVGTEERSLFIFALDVIPNFFKSAAFKKKMKKSQSELVL